MRPFQAFQSLTLFVFTVSASGEGSQYCYSSKAEPSTFCVAFSQVQNETSHGIDLYIAFSALPTSSDLGWSALGTGDAMAGSLMLIMWADKKREEVAVSVRTASTHMEPFTADEIPQVEVIKSTASQNTSHEALVVIYSCEKWPRLDFQDEKQPWIWASNYFQEFETTNPNQHISSHQLHDVFYVNMTSIPLTKDPASTDFLPKVDGFKNFGTWDRSDPPSAEAKQGGFNSTVWHGAVMLIALMGIMAPSAIFMRWKHNTKIHLQSQIAGLLLTITGLLLGAVAFKSSRSSFGLHQVLGLIVAGLIMLQASLGLYLYMARRLSSLSSHGKVHKWLGRSVLTLGIAESGFGLYVSGTSTSGLLTWLFVFLLEGFSYFSLSPTSEGYGMLQYNRGQALEEENDISVDEEGGSNHDFVDK